MSTQEQISVSLQAMELLNPVLRAMVIMDQEQLNSDILSALPNDFLYIAHLKEPKPRWSVTPDGFLCHDSLIYIPNSNDLQLQVLRYKHNHILSRHPSQNKTVDLICRNYTWPGLRKFVKKYCKSCTTCMWAKPQRYKPYGLLKQLLIPECPWNSISMDFMETLLTSSGCDSILVIVDWLSKQRLSWIKNNSTQISFPHFPMTLFTLPTSKNWSPAGQSLPTDFSATIVSYTSLIPMTSSSKQLYLAQTLWICQEIL